MDKQPADWRAEVSPHKRPIDRREIPFGGGTIANQIFVPFVSANMKSLVLVLAGVRRSLLSLSAAGWI